VNPAAEEEEVMDTRPLLRIWSSGKTGFFSLSSTVNVAGDWGDRGEPRGGLRRGGALEL
jgi:hypothetical protein